MKARPLLRVPASWYRAAASEHFGIARLGRPQNDASSSQPLAARRAVLPEVDATPRHAWWLVLHTPLYCGAGSDLPSRAMATIELTRHLHRFFPQLDKRPLLVEAATVAEVVRRIDEIAPGVAFYLCDERGRLRQHVNIFVGQQRISDRTCLSDPVAPESRVFITQALSGG